MTWRRVYRQHKLVFRFDPILDVIEVMVNGKRELIVLDDYRPPHRRRCYSQPAADPDAQVMIDSSERVC